MGSLDQFTYFEGAIPEEFYTAEANELLDILGAPTLFFIPGLSDRCGLITVILHGNETTGFYAVRDILREMKDRGEVPAHGLYLFVGNVRAAKGGFRHLDDQPDFNRIWYDGSTNYCAQAIGLIKHVTQDKLDFAVDFHNNTGKNPFYSCIGKITQANCSMAFAFSPTAVYFRKPREAHAVAFAQHTTAATFECGLSGSQGGYDAARKVAERLILGAEMPQTAHVLEQLELFDSQVRLLVPPGAKVAFGENPDADFCFRLDIDKLNFQELKENALIGTRQGDAALIVDAPSILDASRYVSYRGEKIYLNPGFIPAMLTTDARVVLQDCLGYLMHRLDVEKMIEGANLT